MSQLIRWWVSWFLIGQCPWHWPIKNLEKDRDDLSSLEARVRIEPLEAPDLQITKPISENCAVRSISKEVNHKRQFLLGVS